MSRRFLPGCVALLASAAGAQVDWTRFPRYPYDPKNNGPMVYDSARGGALMLAFGQSASRSDTWEWSGGWMRRSPTNAPRSCLHCAMAYDEKRQRVVLFGADDASGAPRGTWEWDGSDWLVRSVAQPPPARSYHALAFDHKRGRTLLFGGYGSGYLDDTWEWDGVSWRNLAPTTRPLPRIEHAMAWDGVTERVILFGGRVVGGGLANDTWVWDGATWTRLYVRYPQSRSEHVMVWDSTRRRVVMFGGKDGSSPIRKQLDDTWEWDGSSWIQRVVTKVPLEPQTESFAFDARRGIALMLGWVLDPRTGYSLETWSYGPTVPSRFQPFGRGCPGSSGIPILDNGQPAPPLVGGRLEIRLERLPPIGGAAALNFGFSTTTYGSHALPLSLRGIGMPGCVVYTGPEISTVVANVNGVATMAVDLPNDPQMIGLRFFAQGVVVDPGATMGGIVTNAAEIRIGSR